jgi:peptide/nickel transport system substrate-binding protein
MSGVSRRALMLGAAAALCSPRAVALGRKPFGGVVRLRVPWPLDTLDPHAIDDAAAALFGSAIADPLYAVDAAGHPYPALAAGLPELVKGQLRVQIRPNLLSARGRPMDSRDVLWSLARAERAGGAGLFATLGSPKPDPSDRSAITFSAADPSAAAVLLSSPLTAILPRGFSPGKPDGTGAFVANVGPSTLTLTRNLSAARGASFLDRVEVRAASDLKDPLRAFEAGETDASWLGEFLHEPRPGAIKFDAGPLGWVVLRTGKDAGSWGANGVAQKLLDGLPRGRLAHLGLSEASGGLGGDPVWGGEAAEILVEEGATHLEQIGKELAAILSRPGHELRVAVRPSRELGYRRDQGRFALMLELVRPVGSAPNATQLGLLTAVSSAQARKPPAANGARPRDIAATLPLGVVGQLRVTGAHAGNLHDFGSWDLGSTWKR